MSVKKAIVTGFKALGKPFTVFWHSDEGKQYAVAAKGLLSTAEGQVVLAFVSDLNDVADLASPAKRDIALVKISAQFAAIGISLATSEISLLIETAVSYLKGKFGNQDIQIKDTLKPVVADALSDVK